MTYGGMPEIDARGAAAPYVVLDSGQVSHWPVHHQRGEQLGRRSALLLLGGVSTGGVRRVIKTTMMLSFTLGRTTVQISTRASAQVVHTRPPVERMKPTCDEPVPTFAGDESNSDFRPSLCWTNTWQHTPVRHKATKATPGEGRRSPWTEGLSGFCP